MVLEKFGYIKDGEITSDGKLLSKIYGETDLLVAEVIRSGILNSLSAPEIVSVISCFQYEARREAEPKIPRGEVAQVLTEVIAIWREIHEAELDLRLEPLREPDFGFCMASWRWASGHSLSAILKGTELTVGDFVRSMKQNIDLLRQIAIASPDLEPVINQALLAIDRGVVVYAGALV